MNLILENTGQVPYFTNMRWVFEGLGISARDYDWYLSEPDWFGFGGPEAYVDFHFPREDRWLTGEELDDVIHGHELQFVWGVFSAVPKGYRREVSDEETPYGDCNPSFWTGVECKPQLDGALFEIVCWDNTATLLIGIGPELAANFKRVYSDAYPLVDAGADRPHVGVEQAGGLPQALLDAMRVFRERSEPPS